MGPVEECSRTEMATDGIPSLPRVDNAHNNVTGVAVKLDKDGNPKKKRKQVS